MRDVSDVPVLSGVANSLGTMISGDDHGDYTLIERVGIGLGLTGGAVRFSADAAWTRPTSVTTAFAPANGTAAPNPALAGREDWVVRTTIARRDVRGFGWSLDVETGNASDDHWFRAHTSALGHLGFGSGDLQLKGELGIGGGDLPAYRSFVLGGRGTLLGVPFRGLGGRRMALVDVAWALPITFPTPRFPYSRFVSLPTMLAPFLAAGVAGGDVANAPWRGTGMIEPVAGVRLDLWGPLLRIETGVSIHTGQVSVAVDVHPDWWGLM